jgi:hypothetical protein
MPHPTAFVFDAKNDEAQKVYDQSVRKWNRLAFRNPRISTTTCGIRLMPLVGHVPVPLFSGRFRKTATKKKATHQSIYSISGKLALQTSNFLGLQYHIRAPETVFSTMVRLICVDDDAQGQPLEVIWELELEKKIIDREAWKSIGTNQKLTSA